jgi:hypothetical protein
MTTQAKSGGKYPSTTVKSAGGDISAKEKQHAITAAGFDELFKRVEEEVGLPGDSVLYHDPMGFRTSGPSADVSEDVSKAAASPVHYPSDMFEEVWSDAFSLFNQEQRKGAELREAAKTVSKALDRTNYSMPLFVSPEVYISSGENLPLADMLAREAVQEDTIDADEQTDVGSVSQFDEGGAYPTADDTYSNHSYDVVSYGRESEVTDFVQLAAGSLRSTRSVTEEAMMRAVRQYEERQIIQGTNNDANGFRGFSDLVTTANTTDASGSALSVDDIYTQNQTLERSGADMDNIVHVTTHKNFTDLQKELTDYTRYESPGETLGFGFRALDVGGTPVMKSHGVNNTSGSRDLWSLDASGWYMGMLQDATLHPLAKTGPSETFAVDSYGVLVGEGVEHLARVENLA